MKRIVRNGRELRTLLRSASVGDMFFTSRRTTDSGFIGTYTLDGTRTRFKLVCTGKDVGLIVSFRKLKRPISLFKDIRLNRVATVLFSSGKIWDLLVPRSLRTKRKKAPHNAKKHTDRRAHKRKS